MSDGPRRPRGPKPPAGKRGGGRRSPSGPQATSRGSARRPQARPPQARPQRKASAPTVENAGKGERIAKLLARAGVGSRRDIERMIAEGRIAIDGQVLDTPATILQDLKGVTVDGKPAPDIESSRVFLFHKPAGFLTAARDPSGRPTIYDILPPGLPRLMPVGRLDLNTEGLLLLTNDGELKRALELPASGIPRTYRVRAFGQVQMRDLEALALGVTIAGVHYGPVDASIERRSTSEAANIWLRMTLTEGKNREVRNLCAGMGLAVSRLIRTSYGPFSLDNLPVRSVAEVSASAVTALKQSLKRAAKRPEKK